MSKKRRLAFAATAAGVLGAVVVLVLSAGEREPVYEGKPLDVWFLGYRSPDPEDRKRAVEITHQLGTNAIPTLLRMLRAHDPPSKRKIMGFIQRHSAYRISYISTGIRNCAAANACEELDDKARVAVPALIDLLSREDSYVRSAASNALKRIDPKAAANAGVN